jgi:hypothetical protein
MIKEIYIDMDGVLCDFHKRYKDLYGSDSLEDFPDSSKNKIKEGYRKHFKDFVDTKQFATLDMLPDVKSSLKFLEEHISSIYILSSTAREEYWEEIAKQKFEWLKNHDINYTPIFVPGKRFKKFYSGPDKMIIDDTLSVIEDWDSAGGIGVQHKSWKNTINIIGVLF